MTDLSQTIAPKTDQLNADSLISGPITIRVTKVTQGNSKEQPIFIHYDGDDGKPYKPCLSMRRVLFQLWGKNGNDYVGRSMTLYRDPTVKFGGDIVGGIRISHLSDIDKPVSLPLTVTRGSRKPFTVEPLRVEPRSKERAQKPIAERVATWKSMLKTVDTKDAVEELWTKAIRLREEADPDVLEDMTLTYESRLTELEGK